MRLLLYTTIILLHGVFGLNILQSEIKHIGQQATEDFFDENPLDIPPNGNVIGMSIMLYPDYSCNQSTTNPVYNKQSFDYKKLSNGFIDATMKVCITETIQQYCFMDMMADQMIEIYRDRQILLKFECLEWAQMNRDILIGSLKEEVRNSVQVYLENTNEELEETDKVYNVTIYIDDCKNGTTQYSINDKNIITINQTICRRLGHIVYQYRNEISEYLMVESLGNDTIIRGYLHFIPKESHTHHYVLVVGAVMFIIIAIARIFKRSNDKIDFYDVLCNEIHWWAYYISKFCCCCDVSKPTIRLYGKMNMKISELGLDEWPIQPDWQIPQVLTPEARLFHLMEMDRLATQQCLEEVRQMEERVSIE